ncbi:MAG: hypothetical protein AB1Z98_06400 [Nannocystaceae bacterium]
MDAQSPREKRQLEQRNANARALDRGEPLPFPNLFDALDPTKVDPSATELDRLESVRGFRQICRPRPSKRHAI